MEFKDKKTIFDDSKIESHSALTPTYKIPSKQQLTEREMQVYSTVFRRFVAVFCAEDCIVSRTEITIDVGTLETFILKGMMILEPGWTKYDDYSQKRRMTKIRMETRKNMTRDLFIKQMKNFSIWKTLWRLPKPLA